MTFLSDLRIPLHVRGVEADPEIAHALWGGWRVPGFHLPGVRFYDVHGHRDKTPVIHLHDETYDRLIVEVQDPADVVAKVNEALEASRNARSTRQGRPSASALTAGRSNGVGECALRRSSS